MYISIYETMMILTYFLIMYVVPILFLYVTFVVSY